MLAPRVSEAHFAQRHCTFTGALQSAQNPLSSAWRTQVGLEVIELGLNEEDHYIQLKGVDFT